MKLLSLSALLGSAIILLASCAERPYLAKSTSSEEGYEECHKLTESKDYEAANQCFEVFKSRYGGSPLAYEADLEIADNYFRKKEYLLAAESYIAFNKLHPTHEKIGYAYYRTGLCYLRESPKQIDRDQKYLDTAIQYFDQAAASAPSDLQPVIKEKKMEARKRIASRHFYVGKFYHKTGEYWAAIPRFQEVVTNYSGLGLDERALYLMGDSFVHLKEKERALEILGVFEQHFPSSHYRKRLASQIGVR